MSVQVAYFSRQPLIERIHADYKVQSLGLVPEERIEPSSAIGSGYTESKWIVEEILCNVSVREGVPTTTVRLGQVCGDKLGHWNEKEWFPVLIKSALSTHCLPDVEGVSLRITVLTKILISTHHRTVWCLGFLLTMLAAMRDASEVCSIPDILARIPLNPMIFSPQAIPKDSEGYLTYDSFCKQVAEKLSQRPRILGHDRIRSSVHFSC